MTIQEINGMKALYAQKVAEMSNAYNSYFAEEQRRHTKAMDRLKIEAESLLVLQKRVIELQTRFNSRKFLYIHREPENSVIFYDALNQTFLGRIAWFRKMFVTDCWRWTLTNYTARDGEQSLIDYGPQGTLEEKLSEAIRYFENKGYEFISQ